MPPEESRKGKGPAARGGPGGKGSAEPPKKARIDYSQVRTIADSEAERTDRLIIELQELMRQVKREYELWFNGVNPKPPHELRNKLDTHVRLLRNRLPKRTADQFRIGTVLQQYQVFAEFWDKSARKNEEGGLAPWMAQSRRGLLDELQRMNDERQEEAAKPVRSAYLAKITKPEEDVDEMRKVYNSYVAAKKKVGDEVGGADFEKFRAALVKQTKSLIDSGKASSVSYRIEIADGKVAIKAKGEKE
jgi:hypothetical protein